MKLILTIGCERCFYYILDFLFFENIDNAGHKIEIILY